MKIKFASIVLMLSMLSGILAFAADNYTDVAGSSSSKAIRVVSALGIMQGDGDGTFRPDDTLTRAEFARCIAKIYGADESAPIVINNGVWRHEFYGDPLEEGAENNEGTPLFADVAADHWAYSAINAVASLGIMEGVSPNLFEPEREVLYEEAVKTLVTLLGYGTNAKLTGGYPTGYILQAGTLHIMTGISSSVGKPFMRGQVAQLIYNCLDVDIQQVTSVSGESSGYTVTEGRTLMTEMLGVDVVRGELTANSITTYLGKSNIGKNRIEIDGVVMNVPPSLKNAENDIGSLVEAYYSFGDTHDGKNNTLIYSEAQSSNDYLLIDAADITGHSGGTISYEQNGRSESVKIPTGAFIIYNGSAVKTLTDDMLDISAGYIKFMENGTDLIIIKKYSTVFTENVDKVNETIYNKFNVASQIKYNTPIKETYFFDKSGNAVTAEELTGNQVLMVAESDYYQEIVICSQTVDGVISELTFNDDYGVVIDGVQYNYSSEYAASPQRILVDAGQSVTLYLNTAGKIAWMDTESTSGISYGYISAKGKGKGLSRNTQLKIYLTSGAFKVYNVANKVSVSDENNDSSTYQSGNIADISAITGFVGFSVNGDDEINRIYLPLNESVNERRLYKIADITPTDVIGSRYRIRQNTFGWKLYMNAATKVVTIPTDITDDTNFRILATSVFENDVRYTVSGYTTKPDSVIAEFVVYQSDSANVKLDYRTHLTTIKRITNTLNDHGTNVRRVYGMTRGAEVVIDSEEKDDCIFDRAIPDVPGDITSCAIGEGDVIRYSLDSSGYVSSLYLVYDADMPNPSGGAPGWFPNVTEKYFVKKDLVDRQNGVNNINTTVAPDSALQNGNPYVGNVGQLTGPAHNPFIWGYRTHFLGWAVSKEDTNIITATTQNLAVQEYIPSGIPTVEELDATGSYTGIYDQMSFGTHAAVIDVVEITDKAVNVRAGSIADIKPYNEVGNDCSKVLFATFEYDTFQIIIFNDLR